MRLKLASWNVNGLRAVERKGLLRPFIITSKPDILCLQEIKIDAGAKAESEFDLPEYQEFWNHAKRPGYSGTATFVRNGILNQRSGLKNLNQRPDLGVGIEKFDFEGRVQTLEFPKFYLVNAYFPNSRHDLSRLEFKGEFNEAILKHIKKLDKNKPVILTGDYNVAHNEIDLARPKDNKENPGFHPRERAWMSKFLEAGFIDTFRYLHPKEIRYSWWSMRSGARARNIGWRIDYFAVSKRLASKIKKAEILDQVLGSDHCPVTLEIKV
ncbi:MAG TPA: exodeoxyribonuclease III [Candidatus Paceibacterota bacterium]